jgi:hypothetical protein
MTPRAGGQTALVVLDYDSTVQAVAETPNLLEWDDERLAAAGTPSLLRRIVSRGSTAQDRGQILVK